MTVASFSKKFPDPFSIPSSAGTWPTMIVSARPTMKPLSTGSEITAARNPSRSVPASRATMPTASESPVVNARNVVGLSVRPPTTPAESAAVADIGATIRWRELPNSE